MQIVQTVRHGAVQIDTMPFIGLPDHQLEHPTAQVGMQPGFVLLCYRCLILRRFDQMLGLCFNPLGGGTSSTVCDAPAGRAELPEPTPGETSTMR